MNKFAKFASVIGLLLAAQASQAFQFNIQLNQVRCTGQAAEIFGLTPETQATYQPLSTTWIQDLLQSNSPYLEKHEVMAQPYGKLINGVFSGEKGEALLMVVLTKRQVPISREFPYTLTLIIAAGEAKGFALAQHGVKIDLVKNEMSNNDLHCDLSQALR